MKELLIRTRDKLKERWYPHSYAVDKHDLSCAVLGSNACKWSVHGAIMFAVHEMNLDPDDIPAPKNFRERNNI